MEQNGVVDDGTEEGEGNSTRSATGRGKKRRRCGRPPGSSSATRMRLDARRDHIRATASCPDLRMHERKHKHKQREEDDSDDSEGDVVSTSSSSDDDDVQPQPKPRAASVSPSVLLRRRRSDIFDISIAKLNDASSERNAATRSLRKSVLIVNMVRSLQMDSSGEAEAVTTDDSLINQISEPNPSPQPPVKQPVVDGDALMYDMDLLSEDASNDDFFASTPTEQDDFLATLPVSTAALPTQVEPLAACAAFTPTSTADLIELVVSTQSTEVVGDSEETRMLDSLLLGGAQTTVLQTAPVGLAEAAVTNGNGYVPNYQQLRPLTLDHGSTTNHHHHHHHHHSNSMIHHMQSSSNETTVRTTALLL